MLKKFRFHATRIKRIILLALIFLLALQGNVFLSSVSAADELAIKHSDEAFLSNKLNVVSLSLSSHGSEERIGYIKEFITEYSPDILALQNVDRSFDTLLDELTVAPSAAYEITDRYFSKGAPRLNTVPILYNTQRFEALAQGVKVYKSGTGAELLSWTVLEDLSSHDAMLVLNTKFSKSNTLANAKECVELAESIYKDFGSLPTILMGDLSVTQSDLAFRLLLDTFSDSAYVSDRIYSTYNNNFHLLKPPTTENYPTDHVLISNEDWSVTEYSVIRNDLTLKMSDHFPVAVTLQSRTDTLDEQKCGELKIVNAFKHPTESKLFQAIEIVNTSGFPADLYYYRLFYCSADTKEELIATNADNVIKNMRISLVKGKHVLEPEQTAVIWLISSFHYTNDPPLISKSKDGTAIYQTKAWKDMYEAACDKSVPCGAIIVPLDRTSASYFRNGKATNLKNSFCLEAEKHEMLYLTYDNALSVDGALSSFYLPNAKCETTTRTEETSAHTVPTETLPPAPSSSESKPEATSKSHESTDSSSVSTAVSDTTQPQKTETILANSDAYTFPAPSGIQRLPAENESISIAAWLTILSWALISVCFVSIFVLYMRYEKKYNKK